MTGKEAKQDVMKFWPIIATMVTMALTGAVPAILWAGSVSARVAEVERKAEKIGLIAEDIAAIKAILERQERKRP